MTKKQETALFGPEDHEAPTVKGIREKWTPGPWEVHGYAHVGDFYIHGANKICDVVNPSGFYRSPKETEANARLIAAAPELLEGLKGMLEWGRRVKVSNPGPEIRNAIAAIAKAEGR